MRSLGFRAANDHVWWAVVEGGTDEPILVASEKLRPPQVFDQPETLAWYRERVEYLVAKYNAETGGVRYPENVARSANKMFPRIRVEGVLIEAMYSAGARRFACGPLKTISAGIDSKAAKKYLTTDDFRGLDWSRLPAEAREAVLVACAALEDTE